MGAKQWAWLVVRRVLFMAPILLGVVTGTFIMTRVAGGDPAYLIAGPFATDEVIATLREQLGTDRSIAAQYWSYLSDLIRGDLGTSLYSDRPVLTELINRTPATLELILLALTISVALGTLLGSISARSRGRVADRVVRSGTFSALALPDFWLGLVLIYVVFFRLGIAPPPLGQVAPGRPRPDLITGAAVIDSLLTANGAALKASLNQLWLPLMTMIPIFTAPIARLSRSANIEVLNSDWHTFGRACGLPSRCLNRYTIRAALPPVVTFAGILFSVMLGSAVLVETVFSWGGVAQYAINSIRVNDFPAIQGFIAMTGVFSVICFLIVDIAYALIDPRVRL
jgi:ABC-type dipeptide/oligopeptide/nickel transport system permease component